MPFSILAPGSNFWPERAEKLAADEAAPAQPQAATPPSPQGPSATSKSPSNRLRLTVAFVAKMKRVNGLLSALQRPAGPLGPRVKAQRTALAYRQQDLAPFLDLVRPGGALASPPGPQCDLWEAAALWRLGDLALLRGQAESAQQRWWAATTLARHKPLDWQDSLLSLLRTADGVSASWPALHALGLLHAEQIRVAHLAFRWFTPGHHQALLQAVQTDPMSFMGRFLLAADALVANDFAGSQSLFARAAVEMQACLRGDLKAIPSLRVGEEPEALRHRQWQWLTHLWPQEPLFAYAALTAATAKVADPRYALTHGHDVLRLLPNCAHGHQAMAQTLTQLHDYRGATAAWQRAIALGYAVPYAHRELGALLSLDGNVVAAERHFALALRPGDDPAHAFIEDGQACMDVGAFAAALVAFERALAHQPTSLLALTNASTCFSNLGNHAKSLDMLFHARLHAPAHQENTAVISLLYARRYAKMRRDNDAVVAYSEAAALCQDPLPIHLEAARVLMELCAFEGARPHLLALIEMEPNEPNHMLDLALTYLNIGDGKSGLELLLKPILQVNRSASVSLFMAAAYKQNHDWFTALPLFDEAIARYAGQPAHAAVRKKAMRECVAMLFACGAYRQALTYAQAYLASGDDLDLRFVAANAANQLQRYDLACAHALRMVIMAPNHPGSLQILLALPKDTLGRPDDLSLLLPLATALPHDFNTHWQLAQAALGANKAVLAKHAARRAMALRPFHLGARAALMTALSCQGEHSGLYVDLADANEVLNSNDDIDIVDCLNEVRQIQEAAVSLNALLKVDPGNASASELLGYVYELLDIVG